LKTALGDERYADYSPETNYDYQQLKHLTQRDNLPSDTALRAYGLRDNVVQESNRIYDDAALSNEQKLAALQALAQQTRSQLVATLGPVVGPTYVKQVDNQWLNMLERGNAVNFTGTSMTMSSGNAVIVFAGGPAFRNVPRANPAPHL